MSTPPEIAWIVPVVIPLLIGLLVGYIVKHTIKLAFALVALVILLVFTGFISITYGDVFDQALKLLPKIIETGSGLINLLPYSTVTFIIGFVVALWKS
ncbi:MAG: hypothetical protein QXI32_00920 [Candidatus Bathyarchaeia archaeon]